MSSVHDQAGDPSGAKASGPPHATLVLVTTVLASGMSFIDGSVVNVGLPAIGKSLHADAEALQWVINAYLLPLSALLLLGGAAGDRYGQRRLLIWGVAAFGAASAACAAAPGLGWLLAARLVQGAASAIVLPNSLAILGRSFSGEAKGRAVGTWAAAGAFLGAVGPVLGGWMIDLSGWRLIFLINLPLAALAMLLAWRFVPKDADGGGASLDLTGALAATLGLAGLTYGLTVGAGPHGWTGPAIGAAAGGLLMLLAYVWIEGRKGERAMTPLKLFASPVFSGLNLMTLFLYAALGGLMVLLPYVLIRALHYEAAAAGAALLPFPLILALLSPVIGGLSGRIGPRWPLTVGSLIVGAGFVLLIRVGPGASYWTGVLPAMVVISLGLSCAVSPLTTAVLSSVEAGHTGLASGFNSAVARIGGLIATALLGDALAAQGPALIDAFRFAALVGAGLCAASAVSAFLMLRRAT